MVIELRVLQFWPEIILVISNRTRAARSFDFEITRMISDQIAHHSVQLPLLIEKRGKNKRLIKNWLPICLINMDAKIASKDLAKRLENTLPEIILFNQNAFVKGGTIFDAIRTIEDVVDYTKQKGLSGILLAVDFEKAFDTTAF